MDTYKIFKKTDAQNYYENDVFRESLKSVVFLSGRKYEITELRFYLEKYFDDRNFVEVRMLVENQYNYKASLERKNDSSFWSFVPNTASNFY